MKRTVLAFGVAALTQAAVAAAAPTNAWPFVILRSYGSYEENRQFLSRVFTAQERHSGLVDEIWFGGYGSDFFPTPETCGREAARLNLGARERCRALGIAFSYQMGSSIGHEPDDVKRPNLPDDCWIVDRDGRRRFGTLCCTSPFAKDYTRDRVRAILRELRPDSFWPDDDVRLDKLGGLFDGKAYICFCPRCLDLFAKRIGRKFTRETLLAELDGEKGDPAVRGAWVAFNAESLGAFAHAFREAVDAEAPATRLGIQVCGGGSDYCGNYTETLLKALAGPGGKAGIRPGCGYYFDDSPRRLHRKMISIAREAERARKLSETAQICYEAENWPHISAYKSASGMMSECAYALANGCDSLALYWGADQNGEDDASYDHWLDTLAAWRPFFEAERDALRDTTLGGVALYRGGDFRKDPKWLLFDTQGEETVWIALNGVPFSVLESVPDVFYLNDRAVRSLRAEDCPRLFAHPVVVSPEAMLELAARFPDLAVAKKVKVTALGKDVAWATEVRADGYELFPSGRKTERLKHRIRPLSPDVEPLSVLTAYPGECGTCIVPTEFGGKVLVAQGFDCRTNYDVWPGCRRHAVLDGLDRIVPGGMPARLLTDGYATWTVVRKDAAGRTVGVLIVNLGSGETPPLKLAVRRPATGDWRVREPKRPARGARRIAGTDGELVFEVPSVPAFGVVLFEGKNR